MNILSIVGILFVLAFNFEFLSESAREVPVFMVEVFPYGNGKIDGKLLVNMSALVLNGLAIMSLFDIIGAGNDALTQTDILILTFKDL